MAVSVVSATRILHVIPAVAPRYGGPSTAALGMCRAIRSLGVSATIASTDADGGGRLHVPLERVIAYEDMPAIFFRRHLGEGFKWSGRLASWLSGHVADFDAVHIHAVFSHSSMAAGRACQKRGIPYIVRPLGTLDPWSVSRKRIRKSVLFHFGVTNLLARAAAIHYTTREEMRLAETVVPNLPRGVVVPIGIDDALRAPETARDPSDSPAPYVLALSRLDVKKGIDLLIPAFARAASDASRSRWRLVIAGDGPSAHVAALRACAASSGLGSRIEFAGWVSGAEKLRLLSGASLFAAPSRQENFGIAIVEALACGVPAIVTPGVNLAGEIADAGAGWVADYDAAALGHALADAMRSAEERARRGEAARAFAGQFRWPLVARRLAALYQAVAVCREGA